MKQVGTLFLIVCALAITGYASLRTPDDPTSRIASCRGMDDISRAVCYSELLGRVASRQGLPSALSLVARISATDPDFAQRCHNDMHALGKVAYDQFSQGSEIHITDEASYCNYGFYHGFMEYMLAQKGSVAAAQKFCDDINVGSPDRNEVVSNCYHGIGHGLTTAIPASQINDVSAMAAPGLAVCHQIAGRGRLERSCSMGVFNSIELMYEDPGSGLIAPMNPLTLCPEGLDEDDARACYTEMSVLTMARTDGDLSRGLGFVRAIDSGYRDWVIQYLAAYTFSRTKLSDAPGVYQTCKREVSAYVDECMLGTVKGLKMYGPPGKLYGPAVDFCSDSSLSTRERGKCVEAILSIDLYTPEDKAAVCTVLPPKLREGACTVPKV